MEEPVSVTLRSKLVDGGKVFEPGDKNYDELCVRWNAGCEKTPEIIICPRTANEVSETVQTLRALHVDFTVCCGGHSAQGSSTCDGAVIDLKDMNGIILNDDMSVVEFGAGCRWGDVDEFLAPHGLATVGGTVAHTGVGGLILGGGHGYLTPQYGLSIDSLVQVDMVLADGSCVEVGESDEHLLWWAIRGNGSQFGIATKFHMKVYKQDKVWSKTLRYELDYLGFLVAAVNDFEARKNEDGHCLTLALLYDPQKEAVFVDMLLCYNGPGVDAAAYFSEFMRLSHLSESNNGEDSMMTIAELNHQLDPLFEYGLRRRFGSANVNFPLSAEMLHRTAQNLRNIVADQDVRCQLGPVVVAFEVFPNQVIQQQGLRESSLSFLELPHALGKTSKDFDGYMRDDKTSYSNRGNHYDAIGCIAWKCSEIDSQIAEYMTCLLGDYREAWGREQSTAAGMYLNIEADRVQPEVAYGNRLEALRTVKDIYDPHDVFWKPNGIYGRDRAKRRSGINRDRVSFGSTGRLSHSPPQVKSSGKSAPDESPGFFSFDDHFSPTTGPSEEQVSSSPKQGKWQQLANQIRESLPGLSPKEAKEDAVKASSRE